MEEKGEKSEKGTPSLRIDPKWYVQHDAALVNGL